MASPYDRCLGEADYLITPGKGAGANAAWGDGQVVTRASERYTARSATIPLRPQSRSLGETDFLITSSRLVAHLRPHKFIPDRFCSMPTECVQVAC